MPVNFFLGSAVASWRTSLNNLNPLPCLLWVTLRILISYDFVSAELTFLHLCK